MSQPIPPRVKNAVEKNLCVACLQPLAESKVIRGCHERCYRATVRAINRGDIREIDRILSGKLLPAKSGGGKPSNPVTVEARGQNDDSSGDHCDGVLSEMAFDDHDLDFDLDFYLCTIQKRILSVCGVLVEVEDLLWHFYRIAHRNMSICTEVIVETANHSGLFSEFTKQILFVEPTPRIHESRE